MNKNEIEQIKRYYSITNEEFEEMYLQARKITFANYIPTYGRPIAIFTGGQPGAGKIMERLSAEAIRNGYNFILEGTMGKSVYTLDLLQNYKVDYNIIARLLAVSREESLLSIFERYIEMKKAMGIGRMTTIESHDKKYDNFLNIAGTLETRGIEVEVFERSEDIANPNMIYKTSAKYNRYNSVVEALIRGRNNSSRICMNNAIQRIECIKNDLQEFGEKDKYMGQIQILAKIIEKEMEGKKETERD